MKLTQLFEADYKKDYPKGLPPKKALDACTAIAKTLGLTTDVDFSDLNGGGTLPGIVDFTRGTFGDEEWELARMLAPIAIKKAFKDHLGLDVKVALRKTSTARYSAFEVSLS